MGHPCASQRRVIGRQRGIGEIERQEWCREVVQGPDSGQSSAAWIWCFGEEPLGFVAKIPTLGQKPAERGARSAIGYLGHQPN